MFLSIALQTYRLLLYFGLHLNWYVYLGLAVKQNPAYLKLRKLRAAQSIARTVSNIQSNILAYILHL